ncbi:uncharacterized protein MELLADRAFT_87338 [Melampsora larici-populina 98AG31]|uniref:Tet-like 2OG-Fe(II) oxygenase domain-containing protein n=1 Tax=Melampsora larici-populina (strain 98AG31 / pathotype 3-4-7) TaxID=747676 RepID=F4RMW6_MELLP|nr:uncharacterized protein MELLADRAFT_87338 [Melampsora larici-populina 98AG31]EGG06185.1 hypothetical protein MELLADRAFT_87338 [Melampsora larici-populina 98AG31]
MDNSDFSKKKKKRSTSSQLHSKRHSNARHRLRPNPGPTNHLHRSKNRTTQFDALRKELTEKLGLPSDCRLYFMKKYDMDKLPDTPRLKITHHNCVILDAETWKVLQVIRFTPFSEMSDEQMKQMNFTIKTIYNHALARSTVKINHAMKGIKEPGEMYATGYRGASDKGRKFGVTALSAKTSKSLEAISKDEARMDDMAVINDTLAEWMSTLCMRAFQSNRDLALDFSIPSFSDKKWAESPNANVIASSIAVTRDGFNNNPHPDFDATPYAYGLFSRINRATGELHWVKISEYLGDIEGCYFILDQYHIELCLDACDGVVECCWASDELHHTLASTTYDEGWCPIRPKDSPITRFGCSLQISAALVKRIEGLLKMKEGKTDVEWETYQRSVIKCYDQEIENKSSKFHDPNRLQIPKKTTRTRK